MHAVGGENMSEDFTARRAYNAAELVDANVARGLADKVAFIDPERTLTYGALQADTCRFARGEGNRESCALLLASGER